ncbi:MAG: CARDB domain-containing protein, partial [Terriglobia bacterium]
AVVTVLAAQISVSPSSINFGDVVVDTEAEVDVLVSNPGSITLSLSSLSTSSLDCPGTFGFDDLAPPVDIAPGNSISFEVSFEPESNGSCTGTLTITSNAATSPTTVALSGTGVKSSGGFMVQTQNDDSSLNSFSNAAQVVRGSTASATTVATAIGEFSGRVDLEVSEPIPLGLSITCASSECTSPGADVTATSPDASLFLNTGRGGSPSDSATFGFFAAADAPLGLVAVQIVADAGGQGTLVTTVYVEVVETAPAESTLTLSATDSGSKKGSTPPEAGAGESPGEEPGTRRGRRRRRAPGRGRGEGGGPLELPDLEVVASQVTLEPLEPQAGEPVRLLVPVRNRGSAAADEFTLKLTIPVWNVRSKQTLSLSAGEGALVEFAFELPPVLSQRRVAARIMVDPSNRVQELNKTNNFALVRNLLPRQGRASARERSTLRFALGECVSFRFATSQADDCGERGDLELRADNGRLTLAGDSILDLGLRPLGNTSGGGAGAGVSRVAVQVGHVYEVANGGRRAQVRVVRMRQVAMVEPSSGVPEALKTPRVNDPHRIPRKKRPRRASVIRVVVELEWVTLP